MPLKNYFVKEKSPELSACGPRACRSMNFRVNVEVRA